MIKNRRQLEKAHGRGAKIVLGAVEAAIKSVEPGNLIKRAVKPDKNSITFSDIRGRAFKLRDIEHVYVVGAGKATASMAESLSKVLRSRISEGAITIPRGIEAPTEMGNHDILVRFASHPIPDKSSIDGTKKMIQVIEKAEKKDLVIVLISGGGSALLTLPAKGIKLSDKQNVTKQLLASGASIHEINTIRKHISAVKGGQLARHAQCRVVSLVLSDVVGDNLAVIASGPTFPDKTTFSDALDIFEKYKIENTKIEQYLVGGVDGIVQETPKPGDKLFRRVSNILIGNNQVACKSAYKYLAQRIKDVKNLGSEFEGDAQDLGRFIAGSISGPCKARYSACALVAGGETTVKLGEAAGKRGGRNQEAALRCALDIWKSKEGDDDDDVTAAFFGTDGIDGNSDAAGAIVSQLSAKIAERIDSEKYLCNHNSYDALKKMKSLIFTGYTGTNVNDIAIAIKLSTSDKNIAKDYIFRSRASSKQ